MLDRPKVTRRRGYTRISGKHQVTLPADAIRRAGAKPGDEYHVTVDDQGRFILEATQSRAERRRAALRDLKPIFNDGKSLAELEEMRDEWER